MYDAGSVLAGSGHAAEGGVHGEGLGLTRLVGGGAAGGQAAGRGRPQRQRRLQMASWGLARQVFTS